MSKKLRYRLDYDRRSKAVAELRNGVSDVRGGVVRRAGTNLLHEERVKFMYPTGANELEPEDVTDVASRYSSPMEQSIAFPSAGGTGSNHVVLYTKNSVIVYDIEADELKDVTWRADTDFTPLRDYVYGDDAYYLAPPRALDYVVLNDVILFTCENTTIQALIRTFDADGNALFEFGAWDFSPPSAVLESDGFTTARISAPLAYVPDNSYEGLRWNEGDYVYAVHPDYADLTGYETTYNNSTRLDDNNVGAYKMLVVTSRKYETKLQLVGNSYWAYRLVDPTELVSKYDNKWFIVDETTGLQVPYSTDTHTIVVIPNDGDFGEGTEPRLAERYVAILTNDGISVGNVPIDIDFRQLPLHTRESDVDDMITNHPDLIHPLIKATEEENIAAVDAIGAHLIKLNGNEDQDASMITVPFDDITTYPKEDISGLAAFKNGEAGWTYGSPDTRIRDIDFSTEFHTDWNAGYVVEPMVVELGMVLGDWEFRTAGNWYGSYTLQSKRGFEWTTEKVVTSAADYNAIINDGYEGEYGIHYRLLIDLYTASGVHAVRAGFTFSWDNYNCFYLPEGAAGFDKQECHTTWYADEPRFDFNSIVFHQQRLWLSYKSEIYASAVNDIKQFASYGIPTDAGAMSYRLADTRSARINWLHVLGKDIVIGTGAGQWSLQSNTGVLTASTTTAIMHSSISTSQVKPINVGNEMLYVDIKGTRIYATKYDYQIEGLKATEITQYSDDVFDIYEHPDRIVELSYDAVNKLIYVVMDREPNNPDKNRRYLITINYDIDQGIIAVNKNKYTTTTPDEESYDDNISLDGVVQINDKVYIVTAPDRFINPGSFSKNMGMRILASSYEITGDLFTSSYAAKDADAYDAYLVFGSRYCYYRSTVEQQWQYGKMTIEIFREYCAEDHDPALNYLMPFQRDTYYDADKNYYDAYLGIEMQMAIPVDITTFPIDFGGAGDQQTFGKKKNVSQVQVLSDNTAGGYVTWDDSGSKDYYSDGVYGITDKDSTHDGEQADTYYPEARSGIFPVISYSGWDASITLTLHDDSPYNTIINGFLIEFVQGG